MRRAGLGFLAAAGMLAACADEKGESPSLSLPLPSTTDAELALLNIDGQIDSSTRQLAASGRDAVRRQLIRLHLARFRVLNRIEDLNAATELSELVNASDADAAWVQGELASAQHRFLSARALYTEAEQRGLDPELLREPRAALDLALGEAASALERLSDAEPSFGVLFIRAGALAELGRFEEADASYVAALESPGLDVSPLPVAEVYFRRGVMWAEMADRAERGAVMYQVGLSVVPFHVTMNVHGAELDQEGGVRERLEALSSRTDEPEVAGFLGEILAADGDLEGAARWFARAQEAYEVRLLRHREAYLDHASEFFRGPGEDPERALQLALENLALRPNQRAHILALEAALDAQDLDTACEIAGRFDGQPPNWEVLRSLVDAVRLDCSQG